MIFSGYRSHRVSGTCRVYVCPGEVRDVGCDAFQTMEDEGCHCYERLATRRPMSVRQAAAFPPLHLCRAERMAADAGWRLERAPKLPHQGSQPHKKRETRNRKQESRISLLDIALATRAAVPAPQFIFNGTAKRRFRRSVQPMPSHSWPQTLADRRTLGPSDPLRKQWPALRAKQVGG